MTAARMDNWEGAVWAGASFGAVVAAALALLKLFGKGFGWLLDRMDGGQRRRISDLEREVRELKAEVRALTACSLALAEATIGMMGELPVESTARKCASEVLRKAFPLARAVPPDMEAMALHIDRLNEGSKR